MIEDCRSDDSDLCHEMLTKYGFTPEQMHCAAERFRLGRSKSGKTIYWMIDDLGIVRDGRIGDSWVSTMLKARYPCAAPYLHIEHCLFGLHQVSMTDTNKSIGIVESERTAVILSEVYPDLLWMAYSYGVNFTINQLEPLQDHKITLYPRTDDTTEYYLSFLELADQARRLYPLDISVCSFLEDHATPDQKRRKIDILDYLFEG